MSVTIPTTSGSHLMPAYTDARVSDAMRHGVITCPPETPLVTVARMMASQHVHAIVVTSFEAERDADLGEAAWGIVSDRDVLAAGVRAPDMSAGGVAHTDFPRVTSDDTLVEASRRMIEHKSSHAVVVGAASERPIGMLSSLDVAGVIAWGRA